MNPSLSSTIGTSLSITMPIVRLHQVPNNQLAHFGVLQTLKNFQRSSSESSNTFKLIHLIRHAEGTHNVEKDYKNPIHLDAPLTTKGTQQCREFAKQDQSWKMELECILTSPMCRAIETATYCFEDILFYDNSNARITSNIPMIAQEEWRETVNYVCDKRRDTKEIQNQFAYIDYTSILHEHDPIWSKYEARFGSASDHKIHRESNDSIGLQERILDAWKVLHSRPESSIAIVSHSALFMHMFDSYFENLQDIIEYGDDNVETYMRPRFANCECRSVIMEWIS